MDAIRVLLVDDEVDFTAPLAKRLSRRGLDVTRASCAAEALDVLGSVDMDVVLLDIKMPAKDGVNTLGEIRRLYPHIGVVMLTAHVDPNIVIACLGMGAFRYLVKPSAVDELEEAIRAAANNGNKGHGRSRAETTE
ncbi:response regulator [Salidesulfovibrio onnuriiensis]|uniref:response regulator n=1 Tax=Salidesulfovibrio onnuriiensis TaxID=2583823 RepID=UPI0011C9C0C7|nr:response regulator [Salidesulfovibrio onnuriiensis]